MPVKAIEEPRQTVEGVEETAVGASGPVVIVTATEVRVALEHPSALNASAK